MCTQLSCPLAICPQIRFDSCHRYELLSRDENSLSITDSVYITANKDKSLDVQSKCTTIIRFIGSSDSSTNLDAFDPVVLITGICEQILTTRCSNDDVSPYPFVFGRAATHFESLCRAMLLNSGSNWTKLRHTRMYAHCWAI